MLIDLDGWQEYQYSPYYNQLKQLSEFLDVTPKILFKSKILPSVQRSNQCYEEKKLLRRCTKSFIIEDRRPCKVQEPLVYKVVAQQKYLFDEIPKQKPQKKKQDEIWISNYRKSYRIKIKEKVIHLTNQSPLKQLSQLLNRQI